MRTAEFVTPMHPDKMCDRISDGVLDLLLNYDENARAAIETVGSHGRVLVTGEYRCKNIPAETLPDCVRDIVQSVTCRNDLEIDVHLVRQSDEIARGVDVGGAGDQGIMRGYAVDEAPTLMPYEYEFARSLCKFLYEKWPVDGKTQVTVRDGFAVDTVVASFQGVTKDELGSEVRAWLKSIGACKTTMHINPAGDWYEGGFDADAGLTGRKLVVDNYGPRLPLGGGCFSGKDATKVDRSAAYMARKIAVDTLKRHKGSLGVDVELAYAIGVAQPVDATATVTYPGKEVVLTLDGYDLTPDGIIKELELRKPQFSQLAAWGHFGRDTLWG